MSKEISDDELRLLLDEEKFIDQVEKDLKEGGLSITGREINYIPSNTKRVVKDSEGRLRVITNDGTIKEKQEATEKILKEALEKDKVVVEAEVVIEEPPKEEPKKETEDVFENGGLEIFPVVKDKDYKPTRKSAESKAQVVMTETDRRFLTTALHCWEMKKINWDDPVQLEERCRLFFQDCDDQLIKPSVELLATYVGASSRKMIMRKIIDPKTSEEVREILERAVNIITSTMVSLAQEGKIPPLLFIFLAKNNYGYTDKSELEIAPVDNIGKLRSVEDLKTRYLSGITTPEEKDVIDVIPERKEENNG